MEILETTQAEGVNGMTNEERVLFAKHWADELISSWLHEYGAWDGWLEDGDLDEEDLKWIQKNVRFRVTTEATYYD